MNKTGISWATHTYNPVTGCSHISEGCQNCYAEKLALKYQNMGVSGYQNGFKPTFHPERLAQRFPGKGKKIFVGSMSDIFHPAWGEWVLNNPGLYPPSAIIKVIEGNLQNKFILCTKRTEQMAKFFDNPAPDNCWLLTTAENQARLNERLPWLLKCGAKVRGLSLEPLLGPVEIKYPGFYGDTPFPPIQWVIIGCESGANRRPCKIKWVEDIVRQCKNANVAVWVKQLDLNGKCVTDINKFPEHLRIREYPNV